MKPGILILEDDTALRETLCLELSDRYEVDSAADGRLFLEHTFRRRYDLYLLDINVPHIDGLTLLDELRVSGDDTPAIFLSSRGQEMERMEGFHAGCDDYLVKPFSIGELKLRIRALLRRSRPQGAIRKDDILLDLQRNLLEIGGEPRHIERKELEILHLFLSHPGQILSTGRIAEAVYRDRTPNATVIRVHLSKINALFDRKRIRNIRGVGYRYEQP